MNADKLTNNKNIDESSYIDLNNKYYYLSTELTNLTLRLSALEQTVFSRDRIIINEEMAFFNYPKHVSISALHSSLTAPEFHSIEYADDGSPVRWTGPSHSFSFTVFIDRSKNLNVKLQFVTFIYNDLPQTLLCSVDGETIDISCENQNGGYVAKFVLPIRQSAGATVITYTCPRVASPHSFGSSDKRLLGILFKMLTIEQPHETEKDKS